MNLKIELVILENCTKIFNLPINISDLIYQINNNDRRQFFGGNARGKLRRECLGKSAPKEEKKYFKRKKRESWMM